MFRKLVALKRTDSLESFVQESRTRVALYSFDSLKRIDSESFV